MSSTPPPSGGAAPEDERVWTTEWETDWERIWSSPYADDWLAHFDSVHRIGPPSPFFHPSVVRAWAESRGGTRRLRPYFLTARSSDGFTVILPFAVPIRGWKGAFVRKLRPAGDSFSDYQDPIVTKTGEKGNLPTSFWSHLQSEILSKAGEWYDDFEIGRVRLGWHDGQAPWVLSDTAPFLSLQSYPHFDAFMASRGGNLRGDVQRRIRKAQAAGTLEYRSSRHRSVEEVAAWIKKIEEHREGRYPGSSFPRGMLDGLVRLGVADGPVHCSAILLAGRDISWHLGFASQNATYWYVPSFDPAFSEFSPGKIHLYFTIREAFERGHSLFDFLRGEDTYKSGWTDGEEFRMYGCGLVSRTPASRARSVGAGYLNNLGYLKASLRAMAGRSGA